MCVILVYSCRVRSDKNKSTTMNLKAASPRSCEGITLGPWPRPPETQVERFHQTWTKAMNQWLNMLRRKPSKAMMKPYQIYLCLLQGLAGPHPVDFEMPTAWCRGHEGQGHAASAEEREDHVVWERRARLRVNNLWVNESVSQYIGQRYKTSQNIWIWSNLYFDDLILRLHRRYSSNHFDSVSIHVQRDSWQLWRGPGKKPWLRCVMSLQSQAEPEIQNDHSKDVKRDSALATWTSWLLWGDEKLHKTFTVLSFGGTTSGSHDSLWLELKSNASFEASFKHWRWLIRFSALWELIWQAEEQETLQSKSFWGVWHIQRLRTLAVQDLPSA